MDSFLGGSSAKRSHGLDLAKISPERVTEIEMALLSEEASWPRVGTRPRESRPAGLAQRSWQAHHGRVVQGQVPGEPAMEETYGLPQDWLTEGVQAREEVHKELWKPRHVSGGDYQHPSDHKRGDEELPHWEKLEKRKKIELGERQGTSLPTMMTSSSFDQPSIKRTDVIMTFDKESKPPESVVEVASRKIEEHRWKGAVSSSTVKRLPSGQICQKSVDPTLLLASAKRPLTSQYFPGSCANEIADDSSPLAKKPRDVYSPLQSFHSLLGPSIGTPPVDCSFQTPTADIPPRQPSSALSSPLLDPAINNSPALSSPLLGQATNISPALNSPLLDPDPATNNSSLLDSVVAKSPFRAPLSDGPFQAPTLDQPPFRTPAADAATFTSTLWPGEASADLLPSPQADGAQSNLASLAGNQPHSLCPDHRAWHSAYDPASPSPEQPIPANQPANSPSLPPVKARGGKRSKFVSPLPTPAGGEPCQQAAGGRAARDRWRQPGLVNKSFQTPLTAAAKQSSCQPLGKSLCADLCFPPALNVHGEVPLRSVIIPTEFENVHHYKQTLTSTLKEHLNIVLYQLSQQYHRAMDKIDISGYSETQPTPIAKSGRGGRSESSVAKSSNPPCEHGTTSKIVQVKKDGPNKGRYFYACSAPRAQQCKFFQWADEKRSQPGTQAAPLHVKMSLSDSSSITTYFQTNGIALYCECEILKKSYQKELSWTKNRNSDLMDSRKKIYLKLSRKEKSSSYSKDDIWIISKSLTFEPGLTFIAQSVFYGPSSSSEVEVKPMSGYSPSNWTTNERVQAMFAYNASSELGCLANIQEHVQAGDMPVLPYLINRNPTIIQKPKELNVCWSFIENEIGEFVKKFQLNKDQALALHNTAMMFNISTQQKNNVTLIHGVFGAGKSYLLAVTVIFLVKLFGKSDEEDREGEKSAPWKLLISSTTNIAVDRILLGLLKLGFEDFVRVGSLKKIAKPVLPYSVHGGASQSQELKELQLLLRGELSNSERQLVRRSIEQHKRGANRQRLGLTRVVAVTCAAASFTCLQKLQFPVAMLDECSQMTEPASLLPLARFGCRKLVLVGDPLQLEPTIQGSEPGHQQGLQQTLFNRLVRMGHDTTMLRTQYRCHPTISALANRLFYDNQLLDGVTVTDRAPLQGKFPTLCFYNVSGGKEVCGADGSYRNQQEAQFVVVLLEALLHSGIPPANIGIITLYKAQLDTVTLHLNACRVGTYSDLKDVQVSTVDAFQGGEKDVIILSCVRTDYTGFIDSNKRINVALTRAKHHLLIVGNARMLSSNPLWSDILAYVEECVNGIQSSQTFVNKWNRLLTQKECEDPLEDPKNKRKNKKLAKQQLKEDDKTSLTEGVITELGDSVHCSEDEISDELMTRGNLPPPAFAPASPAMSSPPLSLSSSQPSISYSPLDLDSDELPLVDDDN